MKIATAVICTIVILAAGSPFAAQVTNVGLTWQDGFTVARLDVQGAVRFSHQTEEAKDGRPFRVIVDVLAATHQLGQKNFFELPPSPVTKIRTSQYAVQPEQVVRVVFDMAHESIYQITSDASGVIVSFPDKDGKQFAAWSSTQWLASQAKPVESPVMAQAPVEVKPTAPPPSRKTTAELNQSINEDRAGSLAGPAQAAATTPPTPPVKTAPSRPQSAKVTANETPKPSSAPSKTSLPSVAKPDTISADIPRKPDIKPEPPKPMMVADAGEPAATPPSRPAPVTTLSPARTPSAEKLIPSTASGATKPVAKQAETKANVTTTPAPVKTATPSAKTAVSPTSTPSTAAVPQQKSTVPAATAKSVKDEAAPIEETPEPEDLEPAAEPTQEEPSGRSTARFRRSPTSPTKIKGTLVAEFPTRLVIKYEPGSRRDPFQTLIDETKQYNSPVEKRIPNVEGIRLVGVLQSPHGNSALFEDKEGYGYILREGDKIQKGYVLRIQPDRVFFQIFEYGWSRTVALNLESEY